MIKGIMRYVEESIDFQDGVFFKELIDCIGLIREGRSKSSEKNYYEGKEFSKLKECIKKHTNLNTFFINSSIPAAIYVPQLNTNQIMNGHYDFIDSLENRNALEKDLIELSKKAKITQLKGSINLNKSTVDGVFAQINNKVLFSWSILNKNSKYTNEELAAILLHEIGHVFTWCEYLSRTVCTNQALATLIKALDLNCTRQVKEIIFDNVDYYSSDKKEVKEAYVDASNSSMVTVIVAGQAIEKSKSELGFNLYDSVSSEYLADQFATRHGAGRYLVTGLEKLTGGYSVGDSTIIMSMRLALASCFSIMFMGPMGLFFASYLLLSTTIVVLCDSGIENYDNAKSRYIRIKHQNTERLKHTDLSKEEKLYYIEQNEQIDLFIKTYSDNLPFFNQLSYWLKPGYRKAKDFEQLQKQLEKLASNVLFEKAAKLSTI